MRSSLLLAITASALRPARPLMRLRARPEDCPEAVWERIVEAEQTSREKKGQIGAALWGLDKGAIEQNQLRIWETLSEKQASGAKPPKRTPEAEAPEKPSTNPFAGVMKAFNDVYKEADAMGYAQALALNKQLEDKGVLSKAKRKDAVTPPPTGITFEDAPRKSVKRKKGKGSKPKSRKGAGFSGE